MIRFEVITDQTVDKFIEDVKPLLLLHYDELTLDKDIITLDPDWDKYRLWFDQGKIATLEARDHDQLVGYCVFFLERHIHYYNNIFARNDILFLHKDYRKGRTGIELIKRSEDMLKEYNVSKVIWHIKQKNDFRVILHRMGYKDEDILVGKALKEA